MPRPKRSFIVDGPELWRSNGTTTEMVKNINPIGSSGSVPARSTVVGSTMYFTAGAIVGDGAGVGTIRNDDR